MSAVLENASARIEVLSLIAETAGAESYHHDQSSDRLYLEGVEQTTLDEIMAGFVWSVHPDAIAAERDRRIYSTFDFVGHTFQADAVSRRRIAEAAVEASAAVQNNGAMGGDYSWTADGGEFAWIDHHNNSVKMDAPTVVNFHAAARAHEQHLVLRAHRLKQTCPADYADDRHWA